MRLRLNLVCAVALAAALPGVASAAVVTFNATATDDATYSGDGQFYDEAGLRFGSDNPGELLHWGKTWSQNADAPSGATLTNTFVDGVIGISRIGGGTFDLQSIDFAHITNEGLSPFVRYTYLDGSGYHSGAFSLPGAFGLQTVDFDLTDLSRFILIQSPGPGVFQDGFQIDNVRFAVGGVPEPATWALMLAGFALAGRALRSRARPSVA